MIYGIKDLRELHKKYLVSEGIVTTYLGDVTAKSRIKSIGDLYDLKYEETEDDLLFGEELYNVLEQLYKDQLYYKDFLYLKKEDKSLISYQETMGILLNIDTLSKCRADVKYARLKILCKLISLKAFVLNKYYFSRKEVMDLKDKLKTSEELKELYVERFGKKIKTATLTSNIQEYFPDKVLLFSSKVKLYFSDVLDEIDGEKLSKSRTLDYVLKNNKKGYSQTYVVQTLGLSPSVTKAMAEEGKFLKYTDETKEYLESESVDYWLNFKENYVSVNNIYNMVMVEDQPINISKDLQKIDIQKISNDEMLLSKFDYVPGKDTCFTNFASVFLKKEDVEEAKKIIKYLISRNNVMARGTKMEKIDFLFQSLDFEDFKVKKVKKTLTFYEKFQLDRLSRLNGNSLGFSLVKQILDLIISLDKELMKHNDDEIEKMINSIAVTETRKEFINFVNYLREEKTTVYKNKYEFDLNYRVNEKKIDEDAIYTEEQYLRFGFLVFADSHIWYEDFIDKAVSRWSYASVWLYSALNYVCAWRKSDYKRIPRPQLDMSPEEFIKRVKERKLTNKEAIRIAEETEYKIKALELLPGKTSLKKVKPTPLVLKMPESAKPLIGMLLGLCEAHFQINKNSRSKCFITFNFESNVNIYLDFFGEEYKTVIGERCFSNLKAVKNYENTLAKNVDEEDFGSGYIIASIARSHMMKDDKKAKSTAIYLRYFRSLDSSEKLIIEMFERGVCSFVPYVLAKATKGEKYIRSLTLEEQTKIIKENIPCNVYETEKLVQYSEKVFEKGKAKALEIIKYYQQNSDNPNEAIKEFTQKIAQSKSPNKTGTGGCVTVALGKGCIHPTREHCIGCEQDILLKSYLYELGNYVNKLIKGHESSKTKGSKLKNKLILEKVILPIVEETMTIVNEIYGQEDLTEYLELTQIPM